VHDIQDVLHDTGSLVVSLFDQEGVILDGFSGARGGSSATRRDAEALITATSRRVFFAITVAILRGEVTGARQESPLIAAACWYGAPEALDTPNELA